LREKAFVFVAADLCSHNVLFPLETHVITAVANGVGIDDIREAIRHLAPYAGYPTAVEALICLVELENATAGAGRAPARAQRPSHADLPEQVTEEVRERALCTIAADVVNGTLDASFALHVRVALGAGAGEEQVRAVLLIVAEYGIAKSWRAYAALGELLRRGE
jgi:4-carboxymuconolactone decarboxylase